MSLQLAELAIYIPSCIPLFEKYQLNYYLHGQQSLKQACADKALSFALIDAELKNLNPDSSLSYLLTLEEMDLARLIDFINGQHHASEEEVLALLKGHIQYLRSVEDVSSANIAAWDILIAKFEYLEKRLLTHCCKEDEVLFPLLRKLFEHRSDKNEHDVKQSTKAARELIAGLENEHREVITLFNEIKKLLLDIKSPLAFSPEYRVLMEKLHDFEYDFHIHLHIENNVLFPKFRELDVKINIKNQLYLK